MLPRASFLTLKTHFIFIGLPSLAMSDLEMIFQVPMMLGAAQTTEVPRSAPHGHARAGARIDQHYRQVKAGRADAQEKEKREFEREIKELMARAPDVLGLVSLSLNPNGRRRRIRAASTRRRRTRPHHYVRRRSIEKPYLLGPTICKAKGQRAGGGQHRGLAPAI